MSQCEHKFSYQGTVYWPSDYSMPGSGAHERIYGDRYFCEKCLHTKIINERTYGNTYQKPIDGTLPE